MVRAWTLCFQVVEQTFSVEADSTSVKNAGDDSKLTFSIEDSNRENFNVTVTSDEIDEDWSKSYTNLYEEGDGTHEFEVDLRCHQRPRTGYLQRHRQRRRHDRILRAFEITVEDAGDSLGSSRTSAYSVPRGDIVPITVSLENTKSAHVVIGDKEKDNFEINATVTDGDDDGLVTLYLNTYRTTNAQRPTTSCTFRPRATTPRRHTGICS